MDVTPTPAPVAEGQTTLEDAEPTGDKIVRSYQVRLHLHADTSKGPIALPTNGELEAAIDWALQSKATEPGTRWTIYVEAI